MCSLTFLGFMGCGGSSVDEQSLDPSTDEQTSNPVELSQQCKLEPSEICYPDGNWKEHLCEVRCCNDDLFKKKMLCGSCLNWGHSDKACGKYKVKRVRWSL